jgi:LPXTG-site transpeptidase (sortase) family protein
VKRIPFFVILLAIGATIFAGGAGMRVYAQIVQAQTESRLLAARPASSDVKTNPHTIPPADGAPTRISIPALGLWNDLEAVDVQPQLQGDTLNLDWAVADAGWHIPSGWPGWNGNVVIAGHSPSRNPAIWTHSIFRQLAYLAPGDLIEVTAGSRLYTYSVNRVFAISGSEGNSPSAVAWLDRGSSERLTLVTCWPPHTAAYRVIVVAEPLHSLKIKE